MGFPQHLNRYKNKLDRKILGTEYDRASILALAEEKQENGPLKEEMAKQVIICSHIGYILLISYVQFYLPSGSSWISYVLKCVYGICIYIKHYVSKCVQGICIHICIFDYIHQTLCIQMWIGQMCIHLHFCIYFRYYTCMQVFAWYMQKQIRFYKYLKKSH